MAALDLVGTVVDDDQRKEAKRAEQLVEGNELGEAVRQAIKGGQAAVMGAIVASTAASTAASACTTTTPGCS